MNLALRPTTAPTCALCREPQLELGCPSCGAGFHAACAVELGGRGCPSLGCREALVAAAAPGEPPQAGGSAWLVALVLGFAVLTLGPTLLTHLEASAVFDAVDAERSGDVVGIMRTFWVVRVACMSVGVLGGLALLGAGLWRLRTYVSREIQTWPSSTKVG